MEAQARDSFFFRLLSGVFSKISSPRPEKVLQCLRLVSFQKRQDAPFFREPFCRNGRDNVMKRILRSAVSLLLCAAVALGGTACG